jgi:hypothetical protein
LQLQTDTAPPAIGRKYSWIFRLALAAVALSIWFWTQSLIGARANSDGGIGDGIHRVTAAANQYLHTHPAAADALLIVSSVVIDGLAIFLLSMWIFAGALRPFLGLVLVLGLRQIMQALVTLPTPPEAIWHYPGFPSLLVTYGVSNDYFFSGHTALTVLAATELARFRKVGWTALGVGLVLFEMAAVLILRAHYTMDVFTGLVTGLYVASLAQIFTARFQTKSQGPE